MKRYILLLLMGALLSSCMMGSYVSASLMTKEVIAQNGTKVYDAKYDDVWKAVKGILVTKGYYIAFEAKGKGIINTDQKIIRSTATASTYSAQATSYYRQYKVKVKEIAEGKIQVVLDPKMYAGNNDISAKQIWVIEGEYGEKKLWNNFFNEVQELL